MWKKFKELHEWVESIHAGYLTRRGIMPTPTNPPPGSPAPGGQQHGAPPSNPDPSQKQTVRISLPPKPTGHNPIAMPPPASPAGPAATPGPAAPTSPANPAAHAGTATATASPAPGGATAPTNAAGSPTPAQANNGGTIQPAATTQAGGGQTTNQNPQATESGVSMWMIVAGCVLVLLVGVLIGHGCSSSKPEAEPKNGLQQVVRELIPAAAPTNIVKQGIILPAIADGTKVPSMKLLVPVGTNFQTITNIVYPGVGTIFIPPSKWAVVSSVPDIDENHRLREGIDFDRKVNVGSNEYPIWETWGNNTRGLDGETVVRSYWIVFKGTNRYGIRVHFELKPPTE